MYAGQSGGNIVVLDIATTPGIPIITNPSVIAQLTPVNMIIDESGDYLITCSYTMGGPCYCEVFDITAPDLPVKVSEVTVGYEAWSLAQKGDYIYFAGGFSNPTMEIIDFSDPKNISSLRSKPLTFLPYHLKVVGDNLAGTGTTDAMLWDIKTNPSNPVTLDAKAVSGRVCAADGLNVINRDTVHKANPATLDLVHNFDSHSGHKRCYLYFPRRRCGSRL